jgi:hypothetical protein
MQAVRIQYSGVRLTVPQRSRHPTRHRRHRNVKVLFTGIILQPPSSHAVAADGGATAEGASSSNGKAEAATADETPEARPTLMEVWPIDWM